MSSQQAGFFFPVKSRFENCHGLLGVSRDTFLEIITGWAKLPRVTFLEFATGYTIYVTGYFLRNFPP